MLRWALNIRRKMKLTFEIGDTVEIYSDVMSQQKSEGMAKIVGIHSQEDEIADCNIRFYRDPFDSRSKLEKEIHRRQIKR
jgi:hypothetical protein